MTRLVFQPAMLTLIYIIFLTLIPTRPAKMPDLGRGLLKMLAVSYCRPWCR